MLLESVSNLANIVIGFWLCPLYANLDTYKSECIKVVGQVDTGATWTCISQKTLDRISEKVGYVYESTGHSYISGINSKARKVPNYRFNIVLETDKQLLMIRNLGSSLSDIGNVRGENDEEIELDVLLGMNFLKYSKHAIVFDIENNKVNYSMQTEQQKEYTNYQSSHKLNKVKKINNRVIKVDKNKKSKKKSLC